MTIEHCPVAAQQHRERAEKGCEINTMVFEFVEKAIDKLAVDDVLAAQPQFRSYSSVPNRPKAAGDRINQVLRRIDVGWRHAMNGGQQRFRKPRHVPVKYLRLATVGVTPIGIDRAEDSVHGKAVHEGARAIVDRLAAYRNIVSVHHPMDKTNAKPMCDKVALQADDAVEKRKMRIGCVG